MSNRQAWPTRKLLTQLRELGIARGDILFVHTGLRATRLGRSEAPNLLDAYRLALGDGGDLLFPTHSYSTKGSPPFHIGAPCDPSIGMWPELTRKVPGVLRSLNPTHSAAGLGPRAAEFLEGHENTEGVGFGSPLDKLRETHAKVLLVGCGFDSCTALHLAETYAQVPYLGFFPDPQQCVSVTYEDPLRGPVGAVIEKRMRQRPGCSSGFPKLEPMLREEGLVRDGRLAEAHVMLCEVRPLVDTAAAHLRRHPLATLCDKPDCLRCSCLGHGG